MRAESSCAAVPFWQERRNAKAVSTESTWTDPPVVVDEPILMTWQSDLSAEGIHTCRAALSWVIRERFRWKTGAAQLDRETKVASLKREIGDHTGPFS